jgi:hypothetical protein
MRSGVSDTRCMTTQTGTGTYITRLTAARTADRNARTALTQAVKNITIDPAFQAIAIDRDPAGWAKTLRQMADIANTIPALRTAAAEAAAALTPLNAQACWKCEGTGQYSGPTNATRRGVAYCFTCNGRGCNSIIQDR